jgi:hypothetical protein
LRDVSSSAASGDEPRARKNCYSYELFILFDKNRWGREYEWKNLGVARDESTGDENGRSNLGPTFPVFSRGVGYFLSRA